MVVRIAHLVHLIRSESNRRSRGQILVLFAGVLVALVGMAGLATDLGYAFAQRRSIQNAADAGAMAGARAVTLWTNTNPNVAAQGDVQTIVTANKLGGNTQMTTTCKYVNDQDQQVGDCSVTVPATATGVQVTVTETHPTFFIKAVPGGPSSVSTSASATAHVAKVTGESSDGPFIVCGSKAALKSGGTMPILTNDNKVAGKAVGKTFILHGPQLGQDNGDCDVDSQSFKGLADQNYNEGKTMPDWFNGDTGTKAGPARSDVTGIQGCKQGTAEPYDCVLILPVATDNPPAKKEGNLRLLYVVAEAAFQVSSCGANCHQGVLLGAYNTAPDGQGPWAPTGWVRGDGGIVTVRISK